MNGSRRTPPRKKQNLAAPKRAIAADALAADNAALVRLHQFSSDLLTTRALPDLLQGAVDAALELTGADFGNLQLYDKASDTLEIVGQRGFERPFLEHFKRTRPGDAGTCAEAARVYERVIVEDVATCPIFVGTPELKVLEAAGVRAVQSTPIVSRDGRLLGIFSTHWRTRHQIDDRTARILAGRSPDGMAEQVEGRGYFH